MGGEIQPPGRRGAAQPAMTAAKSRSTVVEYRRRERRSDRLTWTSAGGRTPRGSGENQASSRKPSTGIGKTPSR